MLGVGRVRSTKVRQFDVCLEPRGCIDAIINPAVNTTFEKTLIVRGPDQLLGHVVNPQRAAGLGITRRLPSHFLTTHIIIGTMARQALMQQ
jgi:hypothetical protein